MGTVYRAFDVQLRRDVALKVLNRLDNDSLERFVREREITADLDHPNFVRILSMGYLETGEGRRPFYTMPLLRGETLAAMIRRRARADDEGERLREEFTQRRLLQLVQQLCLALESAHARGIVHRDLKPANIIMGPYGETYIVDLGLAKYIQGDEAEPARRKSGADKDEEADLELTAQAPAGTPFYSAPEQILDPASVDARTDVFGLGAILYYILTGHHPLYRPPTAMRRTFADLGPDRVRADAPTTVNESDGFLKKPPFPQWSEAQEAPSSSKSEVVVRALHGVLIPPDEVTAGGRPDSEAAEEETRSESVEPALAAICVKALARKASERFASCRALWRELQQYLEGEAELLFKREAADLTRTMSRRTVPQALRDYELAEGRLRQRIAQKENVGRLGIEEKLDLFDLLLEKAKIYERRGDSGSIVRSVMRAEPIIESTLEVLNRQFIQLLITRGTAQEAQQDLAGAKAIISKAITLAQAHKFEDLLASACGAFGAACSRSRDSRELEAGRAALADSIKFSDRAGDVPQGVRSRLGLARLQLRAGGDPARAQSRLEEALRLSGEDSVLLAETWTALGEFHLARKDAFRAVDHLASAIKHAQEADAQNLVREAHFLLGQARHAQGDSAGRDEHFKQALQVRGPRRTDMERRIAAFLERPSGDARHAAPARAGRKPEAKVK
jgi:serine/threonine protein kinase